MLQLTRVSHITPCHLSHSFINLHEDSQLSECLVYTFKPGTITIGRKTAKVKPDIILEGLSIKDEHAIVEYAPAEDSKESHEKGSF